MQGHVQLVSVGTGLMTFRERLGRHFVFAINALATLQLVWCYLWLTRPYVNTELYSQGLERMPFQGRCLMMPVMWWAHHSAPLRWITQSVRFFALLVSEGGTT